ncbi:hypothetical protein [Thiothrix unzii]|uniref:Avidin family protein n=1 Tax=Thiothrix unzii TaxID=111769 RepID=A0A975IHI4_9GAMM|nr:hypothetical protein [Thiothrix unzii]QTR53688.1 hypothetical protein J9260_00940 [Thiothrix unzii]
MNIIKLKLVLLVTLLTPIHVFADASKADWFGTYAMNHDGWRGTLTITDTPADCARPLWCDMTVRYRGSDGQNLSGHISSIDDNGQHMIFFIHFPGNQQRFDAYIFSWDKSKMAGVTYWGGRKFGFFATKN